MAITTQESYLTTLTALGVCVSARIPVLLWGHPGEGKTAVVESATRNDQWRVETVIITHSEPSDFAGLPMLTGQGTVRLAPPEWAQRLAEHEGPSIAFFDEFSTASPALQAAALRPLTHYEVGSLRLPDTVSFVAAANPADVAAAGWELAAPTASRFIHLDWGMPREVFSEGMLTGEWPAMPVYEEPADYGQVLADERVALAGFLRSRESQLSAIPTSSQDRGRAFPTPRTWDYATRLSAFARAVGAGEDVRRTLLVGAVGAIAANEFLRWSRANDLVDPEVLLADPQGANFSQARPDQVYLMLQAVLSAYSQNRTTERWNAAVEVCTVAAERVGIDPAVPTIRALLRPELRPQGAPVPPAITVFAPALTLAGLI